MSRFKFSFFYVLPLFLGGLFISCSQETVISETRFSLHTFVSLTLYEKTSDSFFNEFFQELEKENAIISNWNETSVISTLSKEAGADPILIEDDRVYSFISEIVEFSRLSHGKFNVLIAPLTYLWGVGTDNPRVPTQEEIDQTLPLLNLDKVEFNYPFISLKEKGMSIDVGAVGKGYLMDYMVNWLEGHGIKKAILNFGGQVYLLGNPKDKLFWKVGLRVPEESSQGYFASIELSGGNSISTSGSYERFFESDGKIYHHILDASTGYPLETDLSFVSIIAPSGLEADYYSTLGLLLGKEEGIRFFTEKGIPAIFVGSDKEIYLVGIEKERFYLLDSSYKLH